MKKKLMLQLLTIIFLILGYTLASGQDYVVTLKGDTLSGKVKYFGGNSNANKYIRLLSPEGKKTNYKVLETKAFRIDNEVFHTLKLWNNYTFMKLVSAGYLNLYYYQVENQTTWDGRFLFKKDGAGLDVPNLGFKKKLSQFLGDCPDVRSKIESGDFGRSDLDKIVDAYNACFNRNDNQKSILLSAEQSWIELDKAVTALPEFDKKNDALEMIREIQRKVSHNETIPSFLIAGIKDALKDQSAVAEKLTIALEKLK